jgi:hypothetical protein
VTNFVSLAAAIQQISISRIRLRGVSDTGKQTTAPTLKVFASTRRSRLTQPLIVAEIS